MNTSRYWLGLEAFFLIAAAAAVSLFFVVYRNNYRFQFNLVSHDSPMQAASETIAPKTTASSQISSDGTKKVSMKAVENPDGTTIYNFSTFDEKENIGRAVFTKTINSLNSMAIPFNAWSPDNKYFFIQENAEDSKKVFAFEAKGSLFSEGEPYLDVTSLFAKKDTENIFDEATGWASETLIIINTKREDGSKGFSYWFEVPSKAIIQLSTEF